MAQITTFIPCIQKNAHSQKLWRELFFFLPTMYGVVSVSLNFKPTSHVNRMKLAMAVLWWSKNLWSSIVRCFFFVVVVAVSFIAVLSVSGGWFHYSPYKQGFLVLSRLLASPHFLLFLYMLVQFLQQITLWTWAMYSTSAVTFSWLLCC